MTRGNLEDRLATIIQMLNDHAAFDDERWRSHVATHEAVAESLRDYKRDANEWRATLADLRLTFIPKAEYLAEHRGLEAKAHGELEALRGELLGLSKSLSATLSTLDGRVDASSGDIKDLRTEQAARRGVFGDARNVVGAFGVAIGIIATIMLILDRVGS